MPRYEQHGDTDTTLRTFISRLIAQLDPRSEMERERDRDERRSQCKLVRIGTRISEGEKTSGTRVNIQQRCSICSDFRRNLDKSGRAALRPKGQTDLF